MKVVYATQEAPSTLTKSMFLAGPSPRDPSHPNWRAQALKDLEEMGYDGTVFIPLPEDGQWNHSYMAQVDWETQHLNMADVIVFWVPRDLTVVEDVNKGESAEKAMRLPAFTTNMEFGSWVSSGKTILGSPEGTRKNRYLEHHARQECVPQADTLKDTLGLALEKLGAGSERSGGEREVPLHIWKLPHFQSWYKAQTLAGNRLDGAKLLWSFRVGPTKGFTFAYTMHVNVHIASEGRNKVNEFVFGRPDIATIVAYANPGSGLDTSEVLDTEVVLIREFRSPACTEDGFIRELPGGSPSFVSQKALWDGHVVSAGQPKVPTDGDEAPLLNSVVIGAQEDDVVHGVRSSVFPSNARRVEVKAGDGAEGSDITQGEDPFVTMTHELEEETGLSGIDPSRLIWIGARQLAGTLSVHKAHVFACELTEEEMEFLLKQQKENIVHGVEEDTERTYVEVHQVRNLLRADSAAIDWSMVGMIMTALTRGA